MDSQLRHDPAALVLGSADDLAKLGYLVVLGLADTPCGAGLRGAVMRAQRPDGGFPSALDRSEWGMRETIQTLLVLLEAGVEPGDDCTRRGLDLVLSHQDPCGGFGENPAVTVPSSVIELRNRACVTWLTASAVELMLRTGGGGSTPCRSAVRWLREMQNPDGSWPMYPGRPKGDPDSTAQIAFLLAEIGGPDDPSFLASRPRLEQDLERAVEDAGRGSWMSDQGKAEPLDAYTLTYVVLSSLTDPPRRIHAGYNVGDPRVRTLMARLVDIQQADGGWRPFWSPGSCPQYSVVVVKALLATGAIAREQLARGIDGWLSGGLGPRE